MYDRYGLLPPVIRHDYERAEMIDRQIGAAVALCAALKDLDENLDVQFITNRADANYGIKPGRWHVVRSNPDPAPDTYIPITTPDGGYREPDFGVVEEMRQRDLWRTGKMEEFTAPTKPAESKAPSREETLDALVEDSRAAMRVAGDGGMEKRKWGKK